MQVFEGLAAEELSADLVAGRGLALDEGDAAAFAAEGDGGGTAGDTSADDEDFILAWIRIADGRFIGGDGAAPELDYQG